MLDHITTAYAMYPNALPGESHKPYVTSHNSSLPYTLRYPGPDVQTSLTRRGDGYAGEALQAAPRRIDRVLMVTGGAE